MIGRGVIARPSLGQEIAVWREGPGPATAFNWSQILGILSDYHDLLGGMANPQRQAGRLKQWIKLLARSYEEAGALFTRIRRLDDPLDIVSEIDVTKERLLDAA
jgi:tRNA-dihydrouridine synthase C